MTLPDLITRLEAATALNASLVIEEAVLYADKQRWIDKETARQAMAWIGGGALLDAALVLVREPWSFCGMFLSGINVWTANLWLLDGAYVDKEMAGTGKTPATAVAVVALRARMAQETTP